MASDPNTQYSISKTQITYHAIIVAGGSGVRMNQSTPKQFIPIAGKPVLMHTISAFYHSAYCPHIILVLPSSHIEYWKESCVREHFSIPHTILVGGEQRFHSVKNALDQIPENSVIAVHDAVRPLVSREIIDSTYLMALEKGNAVTAIASRDSVRRLIPGKASEALNRETIFLVQTPQVFRGEIIKRAYLQPYQPEFTDDASVVEQLGIKINLAEGDTKNIKITYPEDLLIAEYLLDKKNPDV